jgi:hypothetical protein
MDGRKVRQHDDGRPEGTSSMIAAPNEARCPKCEKPLPANILTPLLAGLTADCPCRARLVADPRSRWGMAGAGYVIRLRGNRPVEGARAATPQTR